ncbi:type I restriction endonuclease subunit R [Dolichospermum sp. ST_sed1]|nr:type I restriction endonuclease subunit R [Dolichospermum sp. ST_sed1]MDD1433105.1 type I restriction endonuclease subunit R [Dolichospermum sp. ST_sed6]MDD1435313.1 type I restriction endonuclease subunit R [Dolichospermum sp. ST_sed10]MDD1448116.1 type I restriction endonuclease subunit R [Dolichospermum sp. ST_sed8]MDD1453677.1 type I restriction endonuclease subunit R [Dolichospermum sp. ST_sed7]
MSEKFTESIVEQATLDWLSELGYTTLNGTEIAPDAPQTERQAYNDVILINRLQNALQTINPHIPFHAIQDAIRKITRTETPILYENNRRFHQYLTDGIDVEYQQHGETQYKKVQLIDFTDIHQNDWLVVNQFRVKETGKNPRIPDVVIFINGLPIAVIELKNPTDENATLHGAFNQLQTYKNDIPCLFPYNEILVISDGTYARVGTLTADWERFMPWRSVDGENIAPKGKAELETIIKGIFNQKTILDILQYFIVFEVNEETIIKKMAGYHQYHAVNKAITSTITATRTDGDKKVGVVWHTQGSGKSLTMTFYSGKLIQQPEMENPTLVILTDRNDLDDQLFNTFSSCVDLLHQNPIQAENREHLTELLTVASGGIVFTTIQKFAPEIGNEYPELSQRRNIVLIADEAHRSQYGFNAKIVVKSAKNESSKVSYLTPKHQQKPNIKVAESSSSYNTQSKIKPQEINPEAAYIQQGYATYLRQALPQASFVGFTGTPISQKDRNTIETFGNYIDIYDIQRAVEDEATVKIYYETRLAKLDLVPSEFLKIDPEFEEVTEAEELTSKEKLKSKWARLEALVGAEQRIDQIAKDIVEHFENRTAAPELRDGKGMIVCMSRRICADLYSAIIQLKPEWDSEDDNQGVLKVIMTGSATDDLKMRPHIRSKKARKDLAKRFKKADDTFKLVIVRDMWLTGFDAPSLHTLYVDKPMQGHNLMQAIARVNRVFKDKPGGLIVDYLGIAEQLKEALKDYTEKDRGETGIDTSIALAVLEEKHEIVKVMYHGFDYQKFFTGKPTERVSIIPAALNHILGIEDGKQRYIKAVGELSQAFALVSSTDEAIKIRDEVGFFQAIKAAMVKHTIVDGKSSENIDAAVRQIVSKAIASNQVIDIFASAGLKKSNIAILDDEFLEEVRDLPYRNVALETLQKLINEQIKISSRKNLIQARSFREMLENTIKKYQNRAIETAQVINELIELAKAMREAQKRGENLGLTEDETAFYDALEVNDSAVLSLGDDILKAIARDLVKAIRANLTIDWTVKENVRAKLRVTIKRLLKKYGYPPDKQEKATSTVLEQAELLCKDWVA